MLVDDDALREAMRSHFRKRGRGVEPAGAAGLAGVLGNAECGVRKTE